MSEQNKTACRAFVADVVNARALDALDLYVASDYVDHATLRGLPPTRDGLRDSLAAVFAAFPDYRYDVESWVAEGDMVVARGIGSGTMRGGFLGMPPTGRDYRVLEVHICRMRDGQMVEHWGLQDVQSQMAQLGLMPAAATT